MAASTDRGGNTKMILADKITEERKRLGLSQEELAEKLNVSRQAVSKWESAQTIPDLQRIVAMAELFSVSTDYLLKDDMESESHTQKEAVSDSALRQVSMEEANEFLSVKETQGRAVSLGVMLCILSPVLLIFLEGLAEGNVGGVTEKIAVGIGLAALFLLVATAVFLFIQNGLKTERFEYLEKEGFETAYGVTGLVNEKKADFSPTYTKFLSIGIVLCVLSPLPLIISAIIKETDVIAISMTSVLLCIVAVGVYMIVRVAIIMDSYKVLLQEGDYKKEEKEKSAAMGTVSAVYWGLVTAGYLAWSFITMRWDRTWIIWPVAGVLSAPVMMIVRACTRTDTKAS